MPILKLPKSIKWLFACAIFMLLFLTAYRLVCFSFFKHDFKGAHANLASIIWLGFRFDARVVAVITFFMLLLSVFPATHLFKTSLGKHTAFIVYTLFVAVLLLFYMADFISLVSFHDRLQANLFSELGKNTAAAQLFKRNTPVFAVILIVVVVSWIFYLIIRLLHKLIGKKRSGTDDPLVRAYWQGLLLVLCIISFMGRIGTTPLNVHNASKKIPDTAIPLALTPMDSFFSTLSAGPATDPGNKK